MGKDAVKEFEVFVKGITVTKAACNDAVLAVEIDVKAIISGLKHMHGLKDLVFHLVENFFKFSEDIFGELALADKDYHDAQYMSSGRELGMAFRRILLGTVTMPTPSEA